jgi:diacylglycerol kinase (ATP)
VNVSINLASAIRLAQGSSIKIKFIQNQSLSVQVDGEPWLQPPCEITIEHLNQAQMLLSVKETDDEEELQYLDFEGTLF